MFVKYQTVRNAVIGTTTAVVGGAAAFFGLAGGNDAPKSTAQPAAVAVAHDVASSALTAESDDVAEAYSFETYTNQENVSSANAAGSSQPLAKPQRVPAKTKERPARQQETDNDRYLAAMKLATSPSASDGKGKDVLGRESPWKLNLYDDDQDGQWDRAKLDRDRDDVDDEKWNFKQGRWEKNGGVTIWVGTTWAHGPDAPVAPKKPRPVNQSRPSTKLTRYRNAMKIATGSAGNGGKGKDVLGSSSPWKLNLYDDDRDGQWDRGKLDYDRDEVDDEKWNFKNGRWEKDGGASVWDGNQWVPRKR